MSKFDKLNIQHKHWFYKLQVFHFNFLSSGLSVSFHSTSNKFRRIQTIHCNDLNVKHVTIKTNKKSSPQMSSCRLWIQFWSCNGLIKWPVFSCLIKYSVHHIAVSNGSKRVSFRTLPRRFAWSWSLNNVLRNIKI